MNEAFITRRGGSGGAAGLNFSIINGTELPKSKSKNLLVFPYYETTKTASGVTFTDNGDGTVTVDGTSTASNYSLFRVIGTISMNDPRTRLLPAGTYTLSGCPAGGSENTYKMEVLNSNTSTMLGIDTGAGATFTLTEATYVRVNIVVVAGATASGLVFKPQLEKGEAATEYVRYKYDATAIWIETEGKIPSWDFDANQPALRSNNKNFVCYPFYQTTQATNGITYTDNGDGTIKASGTATDYAYFRCSYTETTSGLMYLRKGTYTLSGCPANGSTDTYAIEAYCYTSPAVIYRDTGAGVTFTLDEDCFVRVAILIKTGTTVTGKVFSPQLEKGSAATDFVAGDATGQVWIAVGAESEKPFNALKKNDIQLYPVAFKRYANGMWQSVGAGIYQNRAWLIIPAFSATINVTYPEGSTCKCTNGSTTLTAPDTSGSTTFTVPNAGTWTITSTANDGSGNTKSETVEITTEGQSVSVEIVFETYLFQNGALVPFETWREQNGTIQVGNTITATFSGEGNYLSSAYTETPVDLTSISLIRFEYTCTAVATNQDGQYTGRVGISTSTMNNATSPIAYIELEVGSAIIAQLDVRSISGSYYIGCWGAWQGNITSIAIG